MQVPIQSGLRVFLSRKLQWILQVEHNCWLCVCINYLYQTNYVVFIIVKFEELHTSSFYTKKIIKLTKMLQDWLILLGFIGLLIKKEKSLEYTCKNTDPKSKHQQSDSFFNCLQVCKGEALCSAASTKKEKKNLKVELQTRQFLIPIKASFTTWYSACQFSFVTLEGSLFKLVQNAKPHEIEAIAQKETTVNNFLVPLLLISKKYIFSWICFKICGDKKKKERICQPVSCCMDMC